MNEGSFERAPDRRLSTGVFDDENRLIVMTVHAVRRMRQYFGGTSESEVVAAFVAEWQTRRWREQVVRPVVSADGTRLGDKLQEAWHCKHVRIVLNPEQGESYVITVIPLDYGGVDVRHVSGAAGATTTSASPSPDPQGVEVMHNAVALSSSAQRSILRIAPHLASRSRQAIYAWAHRQVIGGVLVGRNLARHEDLIRGQDALAIVQSVRGATQVRDVRALDELPRLLETYLPITAAVTMTMAQREASAVASSGTTTTPVSAGVAVATTSDTPSSAEKETPAMPSAGSVRRPYAKHKTSHHITNPDPALHLSADDARDRYWLSLMIEKDTTSTTVSQMLEREKMSHTHYYRNVNRIREKLSTMTLAQRAAWLERLGIKQPWSVAGSLVSSLTAPTVTALTPPASPVSPTPQEEEAPTAPPSPVTLVAALPASPEAPTSEASPEEPERASSPTSSVEASPQAQTPQSVTSLTEASAEPSTSTPVASAFSLALFLGGAKPPSIFVSERMEHGEKFAIMMAPTSSDRHFYVLGLKNKRVQGRLFDHDTCALVLELLFQTSADDLMGQVYE